MAMNRMTCEKWVVKTKSKRYRFDKNKYRNDNESAWGLPQKECTIQLIPQQQQPAFLFQILKKDEKIKTPK